MSSPTRKRARRDTRSDRLDLIFRALGDQTRRAMLARLAKKESATVTELAEPFGMSLPAASRHIKVLERARLLSRSVDGRVHHSTLPAEPWRRGDQGLAPYRQFWGEDPASAPQYGEGA